LFGCARPRAGSILRAKSWSGGTERSVYRERYQRNKRRLGKQRGAKVAQIDIARRLAHASWHTLTRNQRFAPRGATLRLAA
jgi:hypothetical protein